MNEKMNTPETDAFFESGGLQRPTLSEAKNFAHKLERERDEVRECLKELIPLLKKYNADRLNGIAGHIVFEDGDFERYEKAAGEKT